VFKGQTNRAKSLAAQDVFHIEELPSTSAEYLAHADVVNPLTRWRSFGVGLRP
jgi:hypothetical protein